MFSVRYELDIREVYTDFGLFTGLISRRKSCLYNVMFFFRRSEVTASALVHPDCSGCVKYWILGGEGK